MRIVPKTPNQEIIIKVIAPRYLKVYNFFDSVLV